MTTPRTSEIERKARELWHIDRARNGDPSFDIEPEVSELKESGFWNVAVSELMTSIERKNEQWLNNDFPENFSVDIDLLFDSGGIILGTKHTGKSDVAMMIAERCIEKGSIVIVFDPSLDWLTRSSIKQYLKVQSYSNLTIPNESVIYDVSLCSPQECVTIVENFSKNLFERQAKTQKPKQYLLILEEAHTYFYQNCMRSKKLMNAIRLISVGRNVKIGTLLLSQFASVLDKYLVKNNTSQIWLGYTREPNDIDYLRRIIGSAVSELPKLADGQFLYCTRNKTEKIAIQPFENTTYKQQVFSKILEVEPLKPIQTQDNGKTIVTLITSLLWFIAIVYGLSQGMI